MSWKSPKVRDIVQEERRTESLLAEQKPDISSLLLYGQAVSSGGHIPIPTSAVQQQPNLATLLSTASQQHPLQPQSVVQQQPLPQPQPAPTSIQLPTAPVTVTLKSEHKLEPAHVVNVVKTDHSEALNLMPPPPPPPPRPSTSSKVSSTTMVVAEVNASDESDSTDPQARADIGKGDSLTPH